MKKFILIFSLFSIAYCTSYGQEYYNIALSGDTVEIYASKVDSFHIRWQKKDMITDHWKDIVGANSMSNPYSTIIKSSNSETLYFRAKLFTEQDTCPKYSKTIPIRIVDNPPMIQEGDYFRGGFVVQNLSDTLLIARRLNRNSQWGCEGTYIPELDRTYGDGFSNTQKILAKCHQENIAASNCDTLTAEGFDDWFLPSIEEFMLIQDMPHHEVLVQTGGNYGFFWTSNQEHKNKGLYINFNSGIGNTEKSMSFEVVAMRYHTKSINETIRMKTALQPSILSRNIRVSKVSNSLTNVSINYTGQDTFDTTYNWNFGRGKVISGSGPGPYEVTYNYGGLNRASVQLIHGECRSPIYHSEIYKLDLFEDINPGFPKIFEGDVEWGDFNNDGWLDALMTGSDTSQLYICTNDTLYLPMSSTLPNLRYSSCQWIDLNNDGYQDFVISGLNQEDTLTTFYTYLNNNGQSFSEINMPFPGIKNGFIKSLDFNNDGWQDLLISGSTSEDSTITILYKNGSDLNFQIIPSSIENLMHSEADMGDYNNDGYQDLMIIGSRDSVRFTQLYQNKKGKFILSNQDFIPLNNGGVAWMDFNNDGWLDISMTGMQKDYIFEQRENGHWHFDTRESPIISIYENNKKDSFTLHTVYERWFAHMLSEIAWGDYDNDGDEDLFVLGHPGLYSIIAFIGGPVKPNKPLFCLARLYRNEFPSETFFDILPNLPNRPSFSGIKANILRDGRFSALTLGDFNKDNNLDIFREGTGKYYNPLLEEHLPISTTIYRNQPFISNQPPSSPPNLSSNSNCDSIALFWDAATDDHTPSITLAYDIYISSTPGGSDIVSQANIYELRIKQFKLNRSLPSGTYYWSVRARDNAKIWGDWAPEQSFTIELPETPEIWSEGDTLYSNLESGNQWHDVSGPIPGATDQTYVIAKSGIYYNILNQNGCISDTSNILEVYLSNTHIPEWADQINIYPNPFRDNIRITSKNLNGTIEFEIHNPLGQIIQNGKFRNEIWVNTTNWGNGAYSLKLIYEESEMTRKIIKID